MVNLASYQMNTMTFIIALLVKNTINADDSALNREIDTNPKAPKFKVSNRFGITKRTKSIFSKRYRKNQSKEPFFIDSGLKTNPWTHKIKETNNRKLL